MTVGVGSWIGRQARTAPDHIALIAGDRPFSYAELAGRIRRLANGLRRLGWLRTGDAARHDDDGYVWIVDRVADRFLSSGQPVYPGDVERVLASHPAVADAGVVQTVRGVAALVVPSPGSGATEQEILAYGRQHLAPHEAPTAVSFVDRLPRNSVGKLIRSQLWAPSP